MMSDEHPHPLLQQLPLTVSPYINLPTAVPLPYTYQPLPSTLPPSVTTAASNNDTHSDQQQSQEHTKPAYVMSANTGHSAHPDSIIESCRALRAHLDKLQNEAEATINSWSNELKERDLAEKRRVAPGWLDVGEENRLLVPERQAAALSSSPANPQLNPRIVPIMGTPANFAGEQPAMNVDDQGNELDRAFGGMSMKH